MSLHVAYIGNTNVNVNRETATPGNTTPEKLPPEPPIMEIEKRVERPKKIYPAMASLPIDSSRGSNS
jgi:hypothetical protein